MSINIVLLSVHSRHVCVRCVHTQGRARTRAALHAAHTLRDRRRHRLRMRRGQASLSERGTAPRTRGAQTPAAATATSRGPAARYADSAVAARPRAPARASAVAVPAPRRDLRRCCHRRRSLRGGAAQKRSDAAALAPADCSSVVPHEAALRSGRVALSLTCTARAAVFVACSPALSAASAAHTSAHTSAHTITDAGSALRRYPLFQSICEPVWGVRRVSASADAYTGRQVTAIQQKAEAIACAHTPVLRARKMFGWWPGRARSPVHQRGGM